MSALIDLTGRRFGRLPVLRREGSRRYDDGFKVVPLWRCSCDCGKEVLVEGTNLRRGMTRSCGCLKRDYDRKRRDRSLGCARDDRDEGNDGPPRASAPTEKDGGGACDIAQI